MIGLHFNIGAKPEPPRIPLKAIQPPAWAAHFPGLTLCACLGEVILPGRKEGYACAQAEIETRMDWGA